MDIRRQLIIDAALASFSREFLLDMQFRANTAYLGTFDEVLNDSMLLPEQQIHLLRQRRCYRMEYELLTASRSAGMQVTAKSLSQNDSSFVCGVTENFKFTQSYVQKIGDMPNSAQYMKILARAQASPRLALEEDFDFSEARNFYGVFIHNPVGKEFDLDKQKLGSLQFCVPNADMNGWDLQISLPELVSKFHVSDEESIAKIAPTWKTAADRKKKGEL